MYEIDALQKFIFFTTMLPQIPAITAFTKVELLHELRTVAIECVAFVHSEPDAHFGVGIGEKWSQGQQIDHLIRAAKPLAMGFRLPKIVPRLLFGKPNRPSITFQELAAKYQRGLANGGKASWAYTPPSIQSSAKVLLLLKYEQIHEQFANALSSWSEQDLDNYLMPHPIIGKLTVREMVMFTLYHNYHHFAAIRERSAANAA